MIKLQIYRNDKLILSTDCDRCEQPDKCDVCIPSVETQAKMKAAGYVIKTDESKIKRKYTRRLL